MNESSVSTMMCPSASVLDCAGKLLDLTRPRIMGVLNITPDSFSDGGIFFAPEKAIEQTYRMVEQGAAIIDVGGESTRPGAKAVSVAEELDRVLPVIEALWDLPVPVSIDTQKPEVMQAAVDAGAGMINDVNALQANGAIEVAVNTGVPVCLMHMQGAPETMQEQPAYLDVVNEVAGFLTDRAEHCKAAGIKAENIVIDPGFGFGKTVDHNLLLLKNLDILVARGYPVLVGLSRKSLIGKVLGLSVDNRLYPGIALAVIAAWQGASIIRCHDVAETQEAILMCNAVMEADRGINSAPTA